MAIGRSNIGKEVVRTPMKAKMAAKGGSPKLGSGERFSKLTKSLAAKGAKDPKALAAAIGRKKYGAAKMQKMASAGKRGK